MSLICDWQMTERYKLEGGFWSGSGSRKMKTHWSGSNPKTGKKYTAEKKFSSKTTIYLSLCLHKGRSSYKKSLQPSKENIQHFKTWNFLMYSFFRGSFFCPPGSGSGFRIRLRIHWPDRVRIQSGSGSETRQVGIYVPHPLHCSPLPPPPRSVNCHHSTPTPPRQKRRFHHRLTGKNHQQNKQHLQLFSSAKKNLSQRHRIDPIRIRINLCSWIRLPM